jgi:hypothetical protein
MVCWAAGDPQKYSGRSMGDSHRHLMISDQEWDAFMDDFQQTLDRFDVPQQEQGELKAIVESTKESIVVRPFQEGARGKVSNAANVRHMSCGLAQILIGVAPSDGRR